MSKIVRVFLSAKENRDLQDWLELRWNSLVAEKKCTAIQIAAILKKDPLPGFTHAVSEHHVRANAKVMGLDFPIGVKAANTRAFNSTEAVKQIEQLQERVDLLESQVRSLIDGMGDSYKLTG